MNDELERWVNLEGPPPREIREMLDAACDVPDLTPEQDARLTRKLYTAIAADRRRRARQKALTRGLRACLAAASLAATVALALHLTPLPDGAMAQRLRQRIADVWVTKIAAPPRR